MTQTTDIKFIDNPAAVKRPEQYLNVHVETSTVLKSWQLSLFSFEWLDTNGNIKDMGALSETEQEKRGAVEKALKTGAPLEKPVLGIGLQDNIEIGIGRVEFLTLTAMGHKTLPVHIPRSNESDFKDFLTEVS